MWLFFNSQAQTLFCMFKKVPKMHVIKQIVLLSRH